MALLILFDLEKNTSSLAIRSMPDYVCIYVPHYQCCNRKSLAAEYTCMHAYGPVIYTHCPQYIKASDRQSWSHTAVRILQAQSCRSGTSQSINLDLRVWKGFYFPLSSMQSFFLYPTAKINLVSVIISFIHLHTINC